MIRKWGLSTLCCSAVHGQPWTILNNIVHIEQYVCCTHIDREALCILLYQVDCISNKQRNNIWFECKGFLRSSSLAGRWEISFVEEWYKVSEIPNRTLVPLSAGYLAENLSPLSSAHKIDLRMSKLLLSENVSPKWGFKSGFLNSTGSGRNAFYNFSLISEFQLISYGSMYYILHKATLCAIITIVVVNSELITDVSLLILTSLFRSFTPLSSDYLYCLHHFCVYLHWDHNDY